MVICRANAECRGIFMKTIGIVGGAGPAASVALVQRMIELCQSEYGCYRDSDFPKVILISFPFSEMLKGEIAAKRVAGELSCCLEMLRNNGAEVCAIACNTLHAFLARDQEEGLVLLPDVGAEMTEESLPLVLCTTTSARFGVHRRFFRCHYLNEQWQAELDGIIEEILQGKARAEELSKIILAQEAPDFDS